MRTGAEEEFVERRTGRAKKGGGSEEEKRMGRGKEGRREERERTS